MTLIAQQRAQGMFRVGTWPAPFLRRALQGAGFALALGIVLPMSGVAQQVPATAVDHPVVLELYTAQGCASCPPADEMMLDLAQRDDVIALALHVDYWDYIGWADSFADPENGQRQQRYARRHGQSTIYTPQVIINGIDVVEGFRVMQVMNTIAAHRTRPAEIRITLMRAENGGLEIRAEPLAQMAPVVAMASRRSAMPNAVVGTLSMGEEAAESATDAEPSMRAEMVAPGSYSIELVRYRLSDEVEIQGGENAGRIARFANIVTSWETVGTWNPAGPLEMTVPISGTDPVVVIVQEMGQGEILAAARLR
ncbi:DUF1223 domain-containing protein [Pararhodobacter sp.]|uniref:DUF1223 domain-containing protein n=1 Tax=Pararhodobacter sp. TaxID=2127056 RepID=UPI002AFED6C4|nr:DUF1223 domain-containing protein [Pararhodobacter sp.]